MTPERYTGVHLSFVPVKLSRHALVSDHCHKWHAPQDQLRAGGEHTEHHDTHSLSRQETTGARSSAVGPSPNAGGLWLLGAAAAKLGWGGGAPSPPLSSGMNEECIDGRAIDRHYCQRASTSFAARLSRVY